MAVFGEVFGAFDLTISESKTTILMLLSISIPRPPATQIVFNATGHQYRQTMSFAYSGDNFTEIPNLSTEGNRQIHAGWMSFRRYTQKLYDRPKESMLHLKTRMMKSEVVDALLYRCVEWILLEGHYDKLGTAHHRMLLRTLGAWCKSSNYRILSYQDALQQSGCDSIKATVRTIRLL